MFRLKKHGTTLRENGAAANHVVFDVVPQVQILLFFLGCSRTSRMLVSRVVVFYQTYARRCPGGTPIHRYFTALRPPPPPIEKKPRGYLDSIDRKKLNDTVRTSAFARCHYMPKCEHHMIQLQVVIKFLLLMYFLNDLCLASTNRTRDL